MQARLRATLGSLLSTRTRKLLFLILIIVATIIYFYGMPETSKSRYKSAKERVVSLSNVRCVSDLLQRWAADFDAKLVDISVPSLFSSPVLPFVGNGFFGLVATPSAGASSIYLAKNGHLSQNLQTSPLVEVAIGNGHKMAHGGSVVDFHRGIIHHVHYYMSKSKCVSLLSSIYVHQIEKHLLVQRLQFKSELDEPIDIYLSQSALHSWTGAAKKELKSDASSYQLVSGAVDETTVLAMAATSPPEVIHIDKLSKKDVHLPTIIFYNSTEKAKVNELEERASKTLQTVLISSFSSTEQTHVQVWNNLVHDCISVGTSHDGTIPLQSSVVASLYYTLSSIHPLAMPSHLQKEEEAKSDHNCYEGLPTMHVAALWQVPRTDKSLIKLTENWLQYLDEGGCWSLIKKGSPWIVQAISRSFLAIENAGNHLQVAANPVSLKVAITLRQIAYESHNIQLVVAMNRQSLPGRLELTVTGTTTPLLFACPAGCKNNIKELENGISVAFPVIATTPATPVLFISANRDHLLELGQKISWDAHELHKDDAGESETGPGARFWIVLVVLVGLFHVFLLRIVYREYFSGGEGTKAWIYSSAKSMA